MSTPQRPHVHVWVHVIGNDRRLVCRCVCGRTLSPSQIASLQPEAATR